MTDHDEAPPDERDDADDFRCLGCEANIGRRGYCGRCQDEMEAQR